MKQLLLFLVFMPNLFAQTPFSKALVPMSKSNFGQPDPKLNTFTGAIYSLPRTTRKLPDFDQLQSEGIIYTTRLYLPEQKFSLGFPGITNRFEYFGIDYKGRFYVKEQIAIYFELASDDGSKLLIDQKLTIDNDGSHIATPKYALVELTKGFHDIEVQYFQGPREDLALTLCYKYCPEDAFMIFDLSQWSALKVIEQGKKLNLSVANEVFFDSGSFELSIGAKQTLDEIKRLVLDAIEVQSIVITGHTDDVGREAQNNRLSLQRAISVKAYLVKIGLDQRYVQTKGLGKSMPVASNASAEGRSQNRRISILIVKK